MAEGKELKGLSGWLILVGLGTVVRPIWLLATTILLYLKVLFDGTWEDATTVGSEAYHPLWGPLFVGEFVYYSATVLAWVYLIYLFFQKSYRFPNLCILALIIPLVFIPLDAWLYTFVFPDVPMFDPDTTAAFRRALAAVTLWVPYLRVSKRVKATFVEKMPNGQYQPSVEGIG